MPVCHLGPYHDSELMEPSCYVLKPLKSWIKIDQYSFKLFLSSADHRNNNTKLICKTDHQSWGPGDKLYLFLFINQYQPYGVFIT
jgi:hypothetical protein